MGIPSSVKSSIYHACFRPDNVEVLRRPHAANTTCSVATRLTVIRDACTRRSSEGDHHIEKTRFIVDTKHKLLYAMVNKAGSRTVTDFMQELNDVPPRLRTYRTRQLNFLQQLFYTTLTPKEVISEYGDYRIFTVVRHPLQRLVSAYFDFIVDKAWNAFVKSRKDTSHSRSQWFNKTMHVSAFSRFARTKCRSMSKSQNFNAINMHWREYIVDLQPCRVKYDYVFKVETFSSDIRELLNALNKDSSVSHEHAHGAVYSGLSSSIPEFTYLTLYREYDDYLRAFQLQFPEQFEQCLVYYAPSISMFGYSWDEQDGHSLCQYTSNICC